MGSMLTRTSWCCEQRIEAEWGGGSESVPTGTLGAILRQPHLLPRGSRGVSRPHVTRRGFGGEEERAEKNYRLSLCSNEVWVLSFTFNFLLCREVEILLLWEPRMVENSLLFPPAFFCIPKGSEIANSPISVSQEKFFIASSAAFNFYLRPRLQSYTRNSSLPNGRACTENKHVFFLLLWLHKHR